MHDDASAPRTQSITVFEWSANSLDLFPMENNIQVRLLLSILEPREPLMKLWLHIEINHSSKQADPRLNILQIAIHR